MRRFGPFLAVLLAILLAVAPGVAFARAAGGFSFGSRGSRTYMAPPATGTAPSFTAPMQRSLTPQAPYAPQPGFAAPAYGGGYGGRSPFVSGLMGGLVGAGIGGLLFGGGLFHGISGAGGFLGLLLQLSLVFLIGRWLLRRVFAGGQPAFAGPAMFARSNPAGAGPAMPPRPAATGRTVAIGAGDYAQFEQVLKAVQAAWSAHDLATLRQLASPEMVGYFAEQMSEQASRGVRNIVSNVQLDRGDLSEAWSEQGRDYATVAMRFSMTDVTVDQGGHVVDGHPTERAAATEAWTFLRSPGGRWILSAIQQAG